MYSVRGYVSGRVQGVGFRYFVRRRAEAEGLSGYAHNLSDGRVEVLLQGEAAAVARVLAHLREGPPHARVSALEYEEIAGLTRLDGFSTA